MSTHHCWKYILAVFAVVLLVGCSQKKSPGAPVPEDPSKRQSNGTSDPGGGGNIEVSTEEEVIAAIERTRKFITSAKGQRLLTIHLPAVFPNIDSPAIKNLKSMLSKIADPQAWSKEHDPANIIPHTNIHSYLSKSTLQMMTTDTVAKNCAPPSYGRYPDAYASEFKYGANICFNIQHLRRLTPESLYSQILGLWVHELCHLNGCEEAVADALDGLVIQGMAKIAEPNTLQIVDSMILTLKLATLEFINLRRLLGPDLKIPSELEKKSVRTLYAYILSLSHYNKTIINLDALYAANDSTPRLDIPTNKYMKQMSETLGAIRILNENISTFGFLSKDSPQIMIIGAQLACVAKDLNALSGNLTYRGVLIPHFGAAASVVQYHIDGINCDIYK